MTHHEAYQLGVRRAHAARARHAAHRFGFDAWCPDPAAQRHVDGMSAMAEWYVATTLGRPWTSQGLSPDAPDAGDVAGGLSVRWTARPSGALIVHPDEPHTLRCVLVVNAAWPLRIVGWIPCARAQHPAYWRTDVRHPAFFVPQRALAPLDTLRTAPQHATPTQPALFP